MTLRSCILAGACLLPAAGALAQGSWLQKIDLDLLETNHQIAITVQGLKPSPCFEIVDSPVIENFMVTIQVEMRFPENVDSCVREMAPFSTTSVIDTPPPGDYEVQVVINGQMQVQYRFFNVEEGTNTVTI